MQWPSEDLGAASNFHNATGVHYSNAIGESRKQRWIVADYQNRRPVLPSNLRQKRDNLCLQGRVEFAGRFIGDQERRPARHRLGNCDPLTLSATELMRICGVYFLWVIEADLTKQLDDSIPTLLCGEWQVRSQHFVDLRTGRHHWIERKSRILRDQRYFPASDRAQFPLGQIQQIAAADQNRPALAFRVRRQQPQQCTGECALSATGFSQDPDDLPRANLDADAIQGANWLAVFGRVRNRQFPHLRKILL